jgi:hypothetical protein
MPEAHIENGITAQAVIGSASGLARDVFVNTFHFNKIPGGRPSDADLDNLGHLIRDFYTVNIDSADGTIDSWFSQAVSRGVDKCQVKLYRLDDAPPRAPHVVPFTLGAYAGSSEGLPREVALCLSYKALTKPGPRGRGRIYVGPLRHEVVSHVTVGEYRPGNTFMGSLLTAGIALKNLSGAANLPWQVYSKMDSVQHMHTVTDLWVDNEFDIIRARGLRPTGRRSS